MFIALEGIDGCGKTTLAGALAKKGFQVTREPYLSLTKKVVAGTKNNEARELAFYVDRLYHLEKVIIPKLKTGVITDRYKYSQIAYAYARYSGGEMYEKVESLNHNLLEPDLVLFLDIEPEEALRRKPSMVVDAKPYRKTYPNPRAFFSVIRKKYLDLEGDNWKRIDAEKNREKILEEALKSIYILGLTD
ncbi:MAG: dTMP kinase [Candidatus Hydrothermarchaeota archaeon]|jgi:dTMP kinase|nr:dTMP kinase [Candidatus Hydrothermarchaeota archaeon]